MEDFCTGQHEHSKPPWERAGSRLRCVSGHLIQCGWKTFVQDGMEDFHTGEDGRQGAT